jgi:glyoxylase-like metal-dependent hydrolase (beta-lactamase superfamily II)
MMGVPTILLIRGRYNTLYDVGPYSTRHQLLDNLRSHGFAPEDVHKVILSHLHWDHALYMDPFRGAEFIVSSHDYAQAADDKLRDVGTPFYMVDALRSVNLRLVAGNEEIDDGVQLMETPGHTAGMLAVKVTDRSDLHIIAGDAIPHARFLKTGHERGWFDQKAADQGMHALAGMGGIIYPAHDRPFRYDPATKVVTYVEPYTITFTCRFLASGEVTTMKVSSC